jgi:hypothetical protein
MLVSLASIASPAYAQASRTWVSGVGDDVNPCSRTAPCKTFAGAISKTAVNGEINCLDPGGFGSVTITKSITIDCHDFTGAILSAATVGINVAFDSFDGTDIRKTVNIRNVNIQSFDSGTIGIHLLGAGQGSFVNIEDSVIDGTFGGAAGGIVDDRGRGTLTINNTTVRNMGTNGISVSSSNNGSLRAEISNTRVINAFNGVNAGVNANVVLDHVTVSSNSNAGLLVGTSAFMVVDSATISHNGKGIQSTGNVDLSNSNVTYNTTAVSGSLASFSNNRFTKNTSLGTISPIGAASNPTGQQ